MFRKWAGRPTSRQLEQLSLRRDSIVRSRQALAAAREDSLKAARETEAARVKDSLEVEKMFSLAHPKVMHRTSRFGGVSSERQPALFSLIAGTFKEPGNAERYCARLQRKGFEQARLLVLSNGYTLVSVHEGNEAESWLSYYNGVSGDGVRPDDIWLLINDNR